MVDKGSHVPSVESLPEVVETLELDTRFFALDKLDDQEHQNQHCKPRNQGRNFATVLTYILEFGVSAVDSLI